MIEIPEMQRRYLTFNPKAGYPAGPRLFYVCERCGDVLASQPDDNTHCRCRNVIIDIDYGRFSVEDCSLVRLFEADQPVWVDRPPTPRGGNT